MKALILCLGLLTFSAIASEPNYATNPHLAAGKYEATERYDCRGISECEEATIFFKDNKPFIRIGAFFQYGKDNRVLPLQKTATAVLVFSQTFNDDCDDNGCVNVDKISGVVYAKKQGSKYIPSIKSTIETTCGWGDDEVCPNGLTEKKVVRMSRK